MGIERQLIRARSVVDDAVAQYRSGNRFVDWRRRVHAEWDAAAVELLAAAEACAAARDWTAAERHCRQALRFAPRRPELHGALGNVLLDCGRSAEAVAAFQRGLAGAPGAADLWNNLGAAWLDLMQWTDAVACIDRALELAPELPAAHVSRGIMHLLAGEYEQGWPHYEWRLRMGLPEMPPPPPADWRVSEAAGTTVLLQGEQGFGDTIQMTRYAVVLKSHGVRVVIRCPARLVPLLSGGCAAAAVLTPDAGPPPEAASIPMASLPGLLGTTVDSIPAGPYLTADPERVRHWRRELALIPGLRVGVFWQGNPGYAGDRDRSIPLARFGALAQPGVSLISLQRGFGTEQIATFAQRDALIRLGADVDADGAFVDTAAILRNLDLLVTCDTAIAHLGGALGVPVWLAQTHVPHWPWMLTGDRSPWYPTVRLFRQPERGDWETVFAAMATELAALARPGARTPGWRGAVGPLPSLVRTRGGWMLSLANDVYVGRMLCRYGEYSPAEARLLCGFLRPGDTVVEAGAHIGALTLPLAKAVGDAGTVFAFEPQRVLRQLLSANLGLNGIAHVTCLEAAAGADTGQARQPLPDYREEGNFGGVAVGGDRGADVSVMMVDALGLQQCRLLKVDVEGMETDVLAGAQKTISDCRPILYVEADRDDRRSALIKQLRDLDYRLYWHFPPVVETDNFHGVPVPDEDTLVSVNFLCLPQEMEACVDGLQQVTDEWQDWRDVMNGTGGVRVAVGGDPPAAPPVMMPVSPGELFDRLTILELKRERLPAAAHQRLAGLYEALQAVAERLGERPAGADEAIRQLRQVNAELWDAEDGVRACEARQDFGATFVRLARSIYVLNDRRATLKTRVDDTLGAAFTDVKHYR